MTVRSVVRRTLWVTPVFGALVAGWVIAFAAPASAHASLVSSSPAAGQLIDAAPDEVVLRFDEQVRLDLGGGLRVFGPDGSRVDRAATALRNEDTEVVVKLDGAQVGTYTVAWRVVSGDSHVLAGSSVFHVQRETGAVEVADDDRPALRALGWVARWWIVTAMTILGGLAVFGRFVTRRGSMEPVTRRALVVLAFLGLAGAILRFAVQVASASGRSVPRSLELWTEAVSSTRTGQIDAGRVVASAVVFFAVLLWTRRVALLAVMAGSAGVVLANAIGGHAWTVEDNSPALLSSVAHQGAVAVWVGGLVGLLLVLRREPGEAATARFSIIATWAVVAVVVSGVASGWLQTGSIEGLLSTGYGRVLLAKTALFAGMALLGFRNRLVIVDFARRRASVVGGVRAEVAMSIAVLGLTAALVGMVPARAAVGPGPYSANITDDAGSVSVSVTPARPGANLMHLYFFDDAMRPRTVDVAEATVAIGDVPARRIALVPITPNHFTAEGFSLPSAGVWVITIKSISRGVPATLTFEVPVS